MKITNYFKKFIIVLIANFLFWTPLIGLSAKASAAVNNPAPAGKVSFTFDDGYTSTLTQAATTLAKYGIKGTNYISTGCIGMTTAPNSCQANTDATYMSWAQVAQLKTTYGWEIGSHTVNHRYMATSDPEEQPAVLTPAQVTQQLTQSKADLAAHGINATAYASPYGDYNANTLAQIAKYYESQRGFADLGYNNWPNSDYLLRVQQVQGSVSVATIKGYINAAKANNQWLILVFHNIKTTASTVNDDYEYSTAKLDQIAAYAKSVAIPTPTISEAIVRGDTNLMTNSSFNSGLTGWTTDNASAFTADSSTNGSYPDATRSIKITANAQNAHLFSPQVPVSFGSNYLLKNYSNITKLTFGEVGYYIDEYDANGAWVSGQYKATQRAAWADQINFGYSPSNNRVTNARLQLIVPANSGVTGFFDNSQWFSTAGVVTPPQTTNLLTNGNFEAGFTGWRTDASTNIRLDSASNGSPANPLNSAFLSSTTNNAHLFSSIVNVENKAYTLSSYLNIKQRTSGEIGYYIDEYDANGNWISGQWKKAVTTLGVSNVSINYTPSSTNVKKSSVQVIVTANSGIVAYFDNAQLQ